MDYLDRHRADGFGASAELYDRVRPSYPLELIADLVGGNTVHRVLDVGSGTGKLARQLTGPGREVLGVERDPRMAAVAASHGVEVEIGTFETWDAAGRRFDLLTAGQAWHWVDPVAGAVKAREVLVPGARFAALWNETEHVPEVKAVADQIYERHAPDLIATSIVLGSGKTAPRRIVAARQGLIAAGFVDVGDEGGDTYLRVVDYTPDDWVALLSTHSDHAVLDASVRIPLLEELRVGLERLGPTFPVRLHTDVLFATRPAP